MTKLPDVEQSTYDQFEQERLQRDLQQKQQSFSLQSAIGEKIAGLQSLLGGATQTETPPSPPETPPAPVPEPAPAPEPVAASPSQIQPAPEPTPAPPQPEPTPEPAPLPELAAQAEPAQVEPPTSAPAPPPPVPSVAAPEPTPAPSSPVSGLHDWIGAAMGAAVRSGADMQAFASSLQPGGGDPIGSAMGAALRAGADMQQFASSLPPPPTPEPTPAAPGVGGGGGRASGTSVGSVPGWLSDLISSNAPPELANDPDFIRTVAAGAKAESGWDPNAVQKGGGGRGLFQFDLGGMGKPYAGNEQQLLGEGGAQLQASQIVPLYARAYQTAPAELS